VCSFLFCLQRSNASVRTSLPKGPRSRRSPNTTPFLGSPAGANKPYRRALELSCFFLAAFHYFYALDPPLTTDNGILLQSSFCFGFCDYLHFYYQTFHCIVMTGSQDSPVICPQCIPRHANDNLRYIIAIIVYWLSTVAPMVSMFRISAYLLSGILIAFKNLFLTIDCLEKGKPVLLIAQRSDFFFFGAFCIDSFTSFQTPPHCLVFPTTVFPLLVHAFQVLAFLF